jgi:hypothetical protein
MHDMICDDLVHFECSVPRIGLDLRVQKIRTIQLSVFKSSALSVWCQVSSPCEGGGRALLIGGSFSDGDTTTGSSVSCAAECFYMSEAIGGADGAARLGSRR